MAVGKKFYINLLKVFLVTCLICGVGLGYLWFWLSRYESQSVNGAVHSYLTNIVNKNWDAVYQEDTDNFVELNSKDKYVSYLESLYGDNAISAYTYSFTNADENSQYYTLYAYGYQIATLELRKPKSSSTWKVRTLNTSNSYVFDVLDSSISFLINNIVIDSTYTHEAVGAHQSADAAADNDDIISFHRCDPFPVDLRPVPWRHGALQECPSRARTDAGRSGMTLHILQW